MVRRLPLLAGVTGFAAGFALFRALVRRRRIAPAATGVDPRALELRRRLDEARAAAAPSEAAAASADGDLDARRQDVHHRGRDAIDRMRAADDET